MDNDFEIGTSCALRISSNEYLLFFHSVDEYHALYHIFVAVLENSGELLSFSKNLVISYRINDYHIAKPRGVFPCVPQSIRIK